MLANDAKHDQERQAATQLVSRVHNGDPGAEHEMVERYSRGLRFLLRRKTRDIHLTEDFLQETWGIALVKIRASGLDDPGRLAGYLCGIANNLALAEKRRKSRQRTETDSELVALIPDETSNPYRHVSRAEICKLVRNLLNDLKKKRDREILMRFYIREEDKARICEQLGVDSIHFNKVLFRARQRLKSAIEAEDRRSHFRVIS